MAKYTYTGLQYVTMPIEERPDYCEFTVSSKTQQRELIKFETTKHLDGMFRGTERAEVIPTEEFQLPKSVSGVRTLLREMAIEAENDTDNLL